MTSATKSSTRIDYLDAVRAIALLLGIVFHASLAYAPVYIGWAVMDISTSELVPGFMLVSHSFRMALFFLIAGFFCHLTLNSKGTGYFARSRLVRIGIPLLVGWFVLRPLLVSGWIMGAESMRGEVNISAALITGITSLAQLPKDFLVGTHLWFLYYLMLFSLVFVGLRYLFCNLPVKDQAIKIADSVTSWLSQSPYGLIVLSLFSAACLWFMTHWGIDTPDKTLIPHLAVSVLYGGCFLFGAMLHRNRSMIEPFSRLSWPRALVCCGAIIACMLLAEFEIQPGHPRISLLKGGYVLCYGVMMWLLITLTIGICRRLFTRQNPVISYLADASYWLYLVHLPIVVWLQVACAELPLHWAFKLISVCTITLAIGLVSYDTLVRPTALGAILNGKRKARQLFSSRPMATA